VPHLDARLLLDLSPDGLFEALALLDKPRKTRVHPCDSNDSSPALIITLPLTRVRKSGGPTWPIDSLPPQQDGVRGRMIDQRDHHRVSAGIGAGLAGPTLSPRSRCPQVERSILIIT
jgi:hypothetical protein